MATKKRAPRKGGRAPSNELPLTPDELLKRDNIAAAEALPGELAERFRTRRLVVSGAAKLAGPEAVGTRDNAALEWRLPAGAVIGRPGQTASRLRPSPGRAAALATTKPYRPSWADHIHHPKLTVPPSWARGPVSRDGKTGEVYWGVYPPEDRAIYYPSGYPWQCIGKVYVWNDASASNWAWWGSGVLIGPRLVLTAGHVVPWDANTWMMRFIPAYYDGSSVLGAGVESYVSDARGWDVSYISRLPDAYDIAILRLFDPLGSWVGHFGSKPYSSNYINGRWNLTGYPSAIASAQRPSYQLGIDVLGTKPESTALEIDHHGDSTGGDSGGPFWATWSDGFPYAIGTVSGGYANSTEDNNVAAGGDALVDLVRWGLANWP